MEAEFECQHKAQCIESIYPDLCHTALHAHKISPSIQV